MFAPDVNALKVACHVFLDECRCSLCEEPWRKASSFPCGHTFCYDCALATLEGPGISQSECPTCKGKYWKRDLRPNPQLMAAVEHAQKITGLAGWEAIAGSGLVAARTGTADAGDGKRADSGNDGEDGAGRSAGGGAPIPSEARLGRGKRLRTGHSCDADTPACEAHTRMGSVAGLPALAPAPVGISGERGQGGALAEGLDAAATRGGGASDLAGREGGADGNTIVSFDVSLRRVNSANRTETQEQPCAQQPLPNRAVPNRAVHGQGDPQHVSEPVDPWVMPDAQAAAVAADRRGLRQHGASFSGSRLGLAPQYAAGCGPTRTPFAEQQPAGLAFTFQACGGHAAEAAAVTQEENPTASAGPAWHHPHLTPPPGLEQPQPVPGTGGAASGAAGGTLATPREEVPRPTVCGHAHAVATPHANLLLQPRLQQRAGWSTVSNSRPPRGTGCGQQRPGSVVSIRRSTPSVNNAYLQFHCLLEEAASLMDRHPDAVQTGPSAAAHGGGAAGRGWEAFGEAAWLQRLAALAGPTVQERDALEFELSIVNLFLGEIDQQLAEAQANPVGGEAGSSRCEPVATATAAGTVAGEMRSEPKVGSDGGGNELAACHAAGGLVRTMDGGEPLQHGTTEGVAWAGVAADGGLPGHYPQGDVVGREKRTIPSDVTSGVGQGDGEEEGRTATRSVGGSHVGRPGGGLQQLLQGSKDAATSETECLGALSGGASGGAAHAGAAPADGNLMPARANAGSFPNAQLEASVGNSDYGRATRSAEDSGQGVDGSGLPEKLAGGSRLPSRRSDSVPEAELGRSGDTAMPPQEQLQVALEDAAAQVPAGAGAATAARGTMKKGPHTTPAPAAAQRTGAASGSATASKASRLLRDSAPRSAPPSPTAAQPPPLPPPPRPPAAPARNDAEATPPAAAGVPAAAADVAAPLQGRRRRDGAPAKRHRSEPPQPAGQFQQQQQEGGRTLPPPPPPGSQWAARRGRGRDRDPSAAAAGAASAAAGQQAAATAAGAAGGGAARRQKPLYVLSTGLSSQERGRLKELARRVRGVELLDDVAPHMTHLVVKLTPQGRAAVRTVKYLRAVMQGCWVVGVEWAEACLAAGRLVPEDSFEATGDPVHEGTPALSRLRQERGDPLLFSGLSFCLNYLKGTMDNKVLRADLEALLQTSGGRIVRRPAQRSAAAAAGPTFAAALFGNAAAADLYDGAFSSQQPSTESEPGAQALPPGMPPVVVLLEGRDSVEAGRVVREWGCAPVMSNWVFDSISHYQVLSVEPYTVIAESQAHTTDTNLS